MEPLSTNKIASSRFQEVNIMASVVQKNGKYAVVTTKVKIGIL
jgi:hypothetical protein